MQEHHHHVDVNGNPEEVWALFWYRGPRRQSGGPVSIEILHPGDEIGAALHAD